MSTRGQRWTPSFRQPVYYRDFVDSFTTNPTAGSLATVTNVDSIKQSIQNLVRTPMGSIPGRCSIGSKVDSSLFDLGASPATIDALQGSILEVIQNFEPRATSVSVTVDTTNIAANEVGVTVTFTPINLPQVETLTFPLRRVR